LTIPEGSIVFSINAIHDKLPLYRDYNTIPYATTPYPPLYYVLSSITRSLFPFLGSGIELTYRAGRLVTLLSSIASLVLVALIVRQSGGSIAASIAAGALGTSITYFFPWSITCRPDMLALALSLIGLVIIGSRARARDQMAVAAFTLSIMAKHSYVAAPLAVFALMCIERQVHRATRFALALFISLAFLILLIEWWSGGWFLDNVAGANAAPIVIIQPIRFAKYFVQGALVPIVIIGLGTIACGAYRTWRLPLEILYLFAAALVAFVSSAKAGADINYFLEPGLAACIIAGCCLSKMAEWNRNSAWRPAGVFFSLLFLCESMFDQALLSPVPIVRAGYNERANITRIAGELPGDVLVGDAGIALRCAKRVLLLDKFNASYLSDAGRIQFVELLELIRKARISAIFCDVPLDATLEEHYWWPRPIQQAILKNYRPTKYLYGFRVFEPVTDDLQSREKREVSASP
jgi:hypothetical protein